MADEEKASEREQTDESLRLEREKADADVGDRQAAIDDAADAIIERARARADQVLAAARERSDRDLRSPRAPSTSAVEQERVREDRATSDERADADETLRAERAKHAPLPSAERDETDKDLSVERTRSDVELSARDTFLGIVSHDLRNMLNGVVGFAALIAKDVSRENQDEPVVMYAQRIQRAGARMNRLLGDLVDVASIEAGVLAVSREVEDAALVVTEAVDSFQTQASSKRITLATEIVPPLPVVSFDAPRILQVLINLLSNAFKFTPESGKIVVGAARIGDDLRFTVKDSGDGIPGEQLELIFERFLQLEKNDRRGVGLGLYISKCIVQGHGGRIWAESRLGEGSTFCFTLPVQPAAAAA